MKKCIGMIIGFVFIYYQGYSQELNYSFGFENKNDNWEIRNARFDNKNNNSGKYSLFYENINPSNYKTIVRNFAIGENQLLDFSVQVRGENIKGKNNATKRGAGIFVYAYDKNGKALGGSHPPTYTGTFNWKEAGGEFITPKGTAKVAVCLYLVSGTTGKVWFDDVKIKTISSSPQNAQKNSVASTIAESQIKRSSKKELFDNQGFYLSNGKRYFPFGIFTGMGKNRSILENPESHLLRIKNTGFNSIMSYSYGYRKDMENFMGLNEKLGLKVLFNLSNMFDGDKNFYEDNIDASERLKEVVTKIKGNNSLLGWYLGDELDMSHLKALKNNSSIINSLDPNHPTYFVTDKPNLLARFSNIADVMGTDPYPIDKKSKSKDFRMVSEWTRLTNLSSNSNSSWQVIQIFNKGNYTNKNKNQYLEPTLNDVRNMVYRALISGAKGVFLYSYHDLWDDSLNNSSSISNSLFSSRWKNVERISEEVNSVIPAILNNDILEFSELNSIKQVIYKCWKFNGKRYMLLVNDTNIEIRVEFDSSSINLQGNEAKLLIF